MSERPLIEALDISEQLRTILAEKRMTVSELAGAAGVSKSAMEKYLAGPSSPRATVVVNICANLRISAEWLLLGSRFHDLIGVMTLSIPHFFQIIHDLKQPGELRETFERLELGSREFNTFALALASARAEDVGEQLWDRQKELIRAAVVASAGQKASPPAEPQQG